MAGSENKNITYSNRSIAKNTTYNLLGYGVPLLVAILLIPPLIKGLGDERFGILNLAWIVIGYFSFFDFGIGRGLTKVIAEKIGTEQNEEISDIFWTSFFLMFILSLAAAIIISLFMPSIVSLFNISEKMRTETLMTFYALAFSIPIVSTTAGIRGVLEAYQKFGSINLIRIILGVLTFLVPLMVLFVIDSLFWIVIAMIFIRMVIWSLYLIQCFNVNENIRNNIVFNYNSIKPVLKFSIWITIANIVGPIIAYSDRFLIGTLDSAAAITYYATPYQIITKILLIPGAFIAVLFPIFSSSFSNNPDVAKKLFLRAAKITFFIIYPTVFLILTFSYDIMQLWLGEKFAVNSYLILQFLSIGILMNSISTIPNYFFQGIGKPKIPTLINLIELPFYILAMLYSIKKFSINGAAFTYMIFASVDAVIMYIMAFKIRVLHIRLRSIIIPYIFILISLIIPFLLTAFYIKLLFVFIFISIFFFTTWRYLFSNDEKGFLISKLKMLLNN